MTVGFGSHPSSTNGFKKPLLSARQLQELAKTFSHLNIDNEEEELMRAVRKVDLGWNKRKHREWNKVKVSCACGTKTRRNNLTTHKRTDRCKKWHRRRKAKRKKDALAEKLRLAPKPKRRRLKSKLKRVYL